MEYSFRERFYVYIVTNEHKKDFDINISGDLGVRLQQLENEASINGKVICSKLLYWEYFEDAFQALAREEALNQLSKKAIIKIISKNNPGWLFFNENIDVKQFAAITK